MSHTPGMKIAISIPDELFEQAEKLARRASASRSHLFAEALREYVARHDPVAVTETLDEVVARVGAAADPFVSAAARRTLERSDW